MTSKRRTPKSNVIDLRGASSKPSLGFTTEPWTSPSKRVSVRLDVTFLQPPTQGDRLHLSQYLRDVSDFLSGNAGAALFGDP